MRGSPVVYITFLYPPEKCTAKLSSDNSLPISDHFHVMLLLVNVMVPIELWQYSSKLCW